MQSVERVFKHSLWLFNLKLNKMITNKKVWEIPEKELGKLQQEEVKNKTLLQDFDDELCNLMQKYIDVNHKHRDCMPFFDDNYMVEDFNYALNILQRLIKAVVDPPGFDQPLRILMKGLLIIF